MNKIKSKTAVGRFLDQLPDNHINSVELSSKNIFSGENIKTGESLIFELPSKKKIKLVAKLVDVTKCRIWQGNIRLQEFLDDHNTAELREKIQSQGQLIPVMARPIKNDKNYTHEIIYGSRRLYVCSSLGINIKILEADLDDSDALLFMDAENSGREDLSPYEAAKAYKYWIEKGIFKNQSELAERLGITRSWLNKILSLTKIPVEIISAISGPKNLSLKQGLEITRYFTENISQNQSKINNIIANKKLLTPEQIIREFSTDNKIYVSEIPEQISYTESFHKILYSKEGLPICKITHSKQGKALLTFNSKFPKLHLTELIANIENFIKSNF